MPNLEEVRSLINARNTRGEGDELVVGDLLEDWPETPAQLAEIRRIALANPLYRDQLISRDARFTTVLIETNAYSALGDDVDALAGFDESEASATAAPRAPVHHRRGERRHRRGHRSDRRTPRRAGLPHLRVRHAGHGRVAPAGRCRPTWSASRHSRCSPSSSFLALLFRRPAGVVLPLLTVGLSLVSTLSVMAITGYPITLPTQILPSFLLAVGVGYSVHVLVIFFQRRRPGDDKEDAIAFALGHSGLAIVMTCLTTAGGLVSFAAAEIAPIADFGVFAPVGVVMALLFTLVLLPAFTAVFPMREKREPAAAREARLLAAAPGAHRRLRHRPCARDHPDLGRAAVRRPPGRVPAPLLPRPDRVVPRRQPLPPVRRHPQPRARRARCSWSCSSTRAGRTVCRTRSS